MRKAICTRIYSYKEP